MIEVEDEDGNLLVRGPRRIQRLTQPLGQQEPVRQPGQCVVESLMLERFLRAPALGDVRHHRQGSLVWA